MGNWFSMVGSLGTPPWALTGVKLPCHLSVKHVKEQFLNASVKGSHFSPLPLMSCHSKFLRSESLSEKVMLVRLLIICSTNLKYLFSLLQTLMIHLQPNLLTFFIRKLKTFGKLSMLLVLMFLPIVLRQIHLSRRHIR